MKPIVRNLLIGGAIILIGATLIAKEKIDTAIDVFQKITIKPFSLPKKIVFSNPNLVGIPQDVSFKIDIVIDNPDYREFSATGLGVAKLKNIQMYFKDALIGTADLDLEEITVPAQSQFVLNDVAMTGKTLSILSNLSSFNNAKLTDLKFTAVIEVLGYEYDIAGEI